MGFPFKRKKGELDSALPTIRVHLHNTVWHRWDEGRNPHTCYLRFLTIEFLDK